MNAVLLMIYAPRRGNDGRTEPTGSDLLTRPDPEDFDPVN